MNNDPWKSYYAPTKTADKHQGKLTVNPQAFADVLPSKWGIRHKPTGHFMPEPMGFNKTGSSFWNPTDGQAKMVRLFNSRKAAKACLTQWLRGEHHADYDYEDGCRYVYGIDVKPMKDRIADHMEVVEIALQPIQQEKVQSE